MKLRGFFCFLLTITALFLLFSCNTDTDPILHSVNFDPNGGSEIGTFSVKDGELVSEPQDPVRDGYKFMGWYNGEEKWDFSTDTASCDLTLTAQWKKYFTLSFNTNGASEIASIEVLDGDKAEMPTDPVRSGYRFLGWFVGEVAWDFNTPITEDTEIVAKWIEVYTVIIDPDGADNLQKQTLKFDKGAVAEIPDAPKKEGYRFLGWFMGDTEWDFNTPITESIEIVAKWIEVYTVTLNPDGADNMEKHTVTLDRGNIAFEPTFDPEKEGYRFLGWFVGDTEWSFNTPITEDTEIVAKWIEIYTVTFKPNGAENLKEYTLTLDKGSTIPMPEIEPKKEEYLFLGWFFGDDKWIFDSMTVNSDVTLVADWQALADIPGYCTVTFNIAGGIAGEGTKNTTVYGGTKIARPQDPTREGYKFNGWFVDGKEWSFDDPITSDIEITAGWLKYFTVTFDSDNGSDAEQITVLEGEKFLPPTAPIKTGYRFIGWFLEDAEWSFDNDTVRDNITLTAHFVECFNVVFDTDGGSYIESAEVIIGDTVPMPQTPFKESYNFIGWFIGEEEWNFDDPVTSDMVLTAKWVLVYAVDVNFGGATNYTDYTILVEAGEYVTKPEDPKWHGWTFIGWYIGDEENATEFDFSIPISSDLTIVAKWMLDSEAGGTIGPDGSIITPPDIFDDDKQNP